MSDTRTVEIKCEDCGKVRLMTESMYKSRIKWGSVPKICKDCNTKKRNKEFNLA